MVEPLVLGQAGQRLEQAAVAVRVVGVVLDLGEGEELGTGKGGVARTARRLAKVDLRGRLGEGERVVESGGVAAGRVVAHGEAAGRGARHEAGRLERRESAGGLHRAGGAGR
jgi:hypothetical protein